MSPRSKSVLVLGGARSGKSRYASELAQDSGLAPLLIATAQALDEEMAARIKRHQAERDEGWSLVEEPLNLAAQISARARDGRIIVIDCLTLWLSNVMLAGRDWSSMLEGLALTLEKAQGPVILVSNEVGLGIVPDTPLGRDFRDAQGRVNQRLAQSCDRVILMSAGLPLQLKPAERPQIRF
jgi:adenosylcobinamide kinase/adenosylcobinamide-phosphate guanylyltransferase